MGGGRGGAEKASSAERALDILLRTIFLFQERTETWNPDLAVWKKRTSNGSKKPG